MAPHTARLAWRTLLGAAAFGTGYLFYLYVTLPDVRPLRSENPQTTAFIELRARQAARADRTARRVQRWVSYGHISPNLKRAVLVAEDDAFWQHDGIDMVQVRKSLELDWQRGEFARGASTITQQLAKNLYLSPSRNPLRKLRELLIARRLEAELSKTRIFEIYLNVIEWGDGIYGAEAAAETYFGVPAASLGREQAALLAAAIVNPRTLNPAKPSRGLRRRQQIILGRMGGRVGLSLLRSGSFGSPITLHPSRDLPLLSGRPSAKLALAVRHDRRGCRDLASRAAKARKSTIYRRDFGL